MSSFSPFEDEFGMAGLRFRFATEQARDWYFPMRDYVRLEYEWVLANVPLNNVRVIDGGAHHGHYTLLFASCGAHVKAVDPHAENLDALAANMKLNGLECTAIKAALWSKNEDVWFSGEPNGMVGGFTGVRVRGLRLDAIDPAAEVVKLDIEGAEYVVVPACLGTMRASTWIVECHLSNWRGHNWPDCKPDDLARLFKRRGYKLDWVNREAMLVEPYRIGTEWRTHSTLIARRA